MNNFKRLNNYVGWSVFLIAATVYLSTIEKTASLWDCGEFISGAYKLEVMHEPGAPFFLLLGRIFSLFASDPSQVASMVNSMSAIASAFTILFLFWTITAFGRKIYLNKESVDKSKTLAVIGAGVVGSLAYTFSDSFWFSAVEGEVYALSSFFTAVTFWCILKWEEVASEPQSGRWLILIAYLIGISIGVHLLSLLTIPAIAMIYYFKNNEYTHKGALITLAISSLLLLFIQGVFIPGTANLIGAFDIFFVNSFGMPFNSGMIIFILLVIGLIYWGLKYTKEKNMPIANTIVICFMMLCIGYSSYTMVLIRSNANTPINMSAPDDALRLSSYLAREQYGDPAPVFSGQNFTTKSKEGKETKYRKNKSTGRYDSYSKIKAEWEDSYIFPRLWSQRHANGYVEWMKKKGDSRENLEDWQNSKITFADNFKFFISYQLGWSYFRYFMWNFAGRQNDIRNMDGNEVHGNWESGIGYSDENMPKDLKDNKAKNHYYFLPLIIGLLGLFFHFKKNKTDAISVLLFFLFTGIFIILFLNIQPDQPRERDYAYVGSFYAFSIWIGLGVLAIYEILKEKINRQAATISATLLCLIGGPILMASENWDDHDRSGRTIALDVGKNYLETCDKNAILFTNGDNDTYPLWYAQEVEGIRTDVMNVNMSLAQAAYYTAQVKRKKNNADPVPHSLSENFIQKVEERREKGLVTVAIDGLYYPQIVDENGNISYSVVDSTNKKNPMDLKDAMEMIKDMKRCPKYVYIKTPNGGKITFSIRGYQQKQGDGLVEAIGVADLLFLDILANFDWKRPLYFSNPYQTFQAFMGEGNNGKFSLLPYIQAEGLLYKLVDEKKSGRPNVDKTYDLVMNVYNYGNIDNPDIYVCHNTNISSSAFRNPFLMLTNSLLKRKDTAKANLVAEKYFKSMPYSTLQTDRVSVGLLENYAKSNYKKAQKIADEMLNELNKQYTYVNNLTHTSGLKGETEDKILEVRKILASIYKTSNNSNLSNFATESINFINNNNIIKKRTDKLEEALNEYIALQSKGTIFTFRHNNGPSLYDILLNRGKPTKLQNDIIKMIQQDEKFGSQLNKILTYSNTLGEFMTLKNEKETLKSTDNNKKSDKISN